MALTALSRFFVVASVLVLDSTGTQGQESITGSGCSVKDPLYGHVFDLTPLSNLSEPPTLQIESETFYFLPCKALDAAKCGPNASICSHKDSKKLKLGSVSDSVMYNDGALTMRFTNGDPCPGSQSKSETYSTQIVFACNHTATGAGQIDLLHEDKASCSYTFLWRTQAVCAPRTQVDCKVTDTTGEEPVVYDLSSLTMVEENWEVQVPNPVGATGFKKILFNVCHSHIHAHASQCDYEAAACLAEDFETRRFTDVGHALEGPVLGPNHTIKLVYAGGAPCNASGQYQLAKTTLVFQCDETATGTQPVLTNFTACEYNILWRTAAACPQPKQMDNVQTDCRIEGLEGSVDVVPLAGRDYEVKLNQTHSYRLQVCGPVKHSKCRPGSAVCYNTPTSTTSLGQATMKPVWVRDGEVQLMYSHGDPCHGTMPATSRILFFCDPVAGQGRPILGEISEDCQHVFHWNTSLACTLNASLETITNCQFKKPEMVFALQTLPLVTVAVNKSYVLIQWCQFESYQIMGDVLRLVKPGTCQVGNQTMEVYVTCNEVQQEPIVLLNEACKLIVTWASPSACVFFNRDSGSAVVPVLLVLVVSSALILIAVLVLRKRCLLRKLIGPNFDNVRYTQIPINETIMDAEEREPLNPNLASLHDQSDDELLT